MGGSSSKSNEPTKTPSSSKKKSSTTTPTKATTFKKDGNIDGSGAKNKNPNGGGIENADGDGDGWEALFADHVSPTPSEVAKEDKKKRKARQHQPIDPSINHNEYIRRSRALKDIFSQKKKTGGGGDISGGSNNNGTIKKPTAASLSKAQTDRTMWIRLCAFQEYFHVHHQRVPRLLTDEEIYAMFISAASPFCVYHTNTTNNSGISQSHNSSSSSSKSNQKQPKQQQKQHPFLAQFNKLEFESVIFRRLRAFYDFYAHDDGKTDDQIRKERLEKFGGGNGGHNHHNNHHHSYDKMWSTLEQRYGSEALVYLSPYIMTTASNNSNSNNKNNKRKKKIRNPYRLPAFDRLKNYYLAYFSSSSPTFQASFSTFFLPPDLGLDDDGAGLLLEDGVPEVSLGSLQRFTEDAEGFRRRR